MKMKLHRKRSQRFEHFLTSMNVWADSENDPVRPDWFDQELFEIGKNFMKEYRFGICLAYLLGLIFELCHNVGRRYLIYTGQSNTPKTAMRRYLSTIKHVMAWEGFETWDSKDDAFRDALRVRKIHKNIFTRMHDDPNFEEICDEKIENFSPPTLAPTIRQDLRMQGFSITQKVDETELVRVSQYAMVVTQHAFVSIMVLHPEWMGAYWASDKQLEGFVHFWRVFGWLLGIRDDFNLCSGNLPEVRSLCKEIDEHILFPSLANVGDDFEHMTEVLVEGMKKGSLIQLDFDVLFLYLATMKGLQLPGTLKLISLKNYLRYIVVAFITRIVLLIPGLNLVLSSHFTKLLEHIWDELRI